MSTIAETYVVKLNYDGQMRRFPVAVGTSFQSLRDQVSALLALPKDAGVVLKYSDEEGDLITISSDLELTSALVPGKLLRLTVLDRRAGEGGGVHYPHLDAPMLDAAPSAPMHSVGADAFRGFPSDGSAPPHHPPGFIVPGYGGVGPHSHPPPPPPPHPHAHPHGPHRGGPHSGPYRGGPHHHHHHRGGFGHHGRGGFHGYGPYAYPPLGGGASREDWRAMRKEDKIARKEMKREFKEAHKAMKKDKEGGRGRGKGEGGGYPFRCADGVAWGFASESANERFVARFAKDVSVPDGTQIQPRTPFVKTWRLRNEGPAWPAGCMLRFLGKHSDNMGASENAPLPLLETVAPNTEVEVSVNLVAPEKPGRYTGYWKMCTPDGRKFGQRVWVSIIVPSSSSSLTPTPSSSSSSSDSDKEADRYEALVDRVLSTGMNVKRHRVFRMLQKCDGDVNAVCEKLAKKEEKKTRKAMKKQMKI